MLPLQVWWHDWYFHSAPWWSWILLFQHKPIGWWWWTWYFWYWDEQSTDMHSNWRLFWCRRIRHGYVQHCYLCGKRYVLELTTSYFILCVTMCTKWTFSRKIVHDTICLYFCDTGNSYPFCRRWSSSCLSDGNRHYSLDQYHRPLVPWFHRIQNIRRHDRNMFSRKIHQKFRKLYLLN